MNKIKKAFLLCLSVVFCFVLAMFATACGNSGANNSSDQSTDDEIVAISTDDEIVAIYNLYVADVTAKGNTPLSYEEWLETVRGQDGRGIASARINENGEFVINFTDGSYTNLGVIAPNGKYVTDISVVGNVISITFSDGSTAQYTTDGTTVCNHENLIYVEMVPHKINRDGVTFTNGVYLELCPDCGSTTTVIGVHHNFVDTVVAPTCTENGYTDEICRVCGYVGEQTDIVGALGHTFEMRPLLDGDAQAAKRWCEEGGIAVEICSHCNLAGEYRTISRDQAFGHHSDSWKVSVEPTWDNVGTLTGMCMVCGNVVEMCIPACSDEAYVVTNVTPENASCSVTKKGTFTIEIDGQKIVIEVVAIPGSMHKLNGQMVDDKATKIFDSVEALNNAGYKLFGNPTTFPCDEASSAYFTCDECDEIVAVTVRKRHDSADHSAKVVKAPTCEKEGIIEFDCVTCGNTVQETIPAVGHDYKYMYNASSSIMVGECQNIRNEKVNECECPVDVIENIKSSIMEVIFEATCQQSGLEKYTLELTNGEVKKIYVLTDKLDHVLEKADGTTKRISEGAKLLRSSYPEIMKYGNAVESCKAPFGGYFACKDCNELVDVTLYIPHTVKEGTEKNKVEATCLTDGTGDYECAVCNEIISEVYERALGHDYDCTLVRNDDYYDQDQVVLKCRRCEYTETIQGRITGITLLSEPNCQQEGLELVMFESDSGYREPFTVAIAKTSHTLNGKFIDNSKPVDGTMDGVKIFADADMGAICSDGVSGYFTCEACAKVVSVTVVFPHIMPATISDDALVAPTCEKNGQIKYVCERCGENVCEVIPCLEHEIKPQVTYNGWDIVIDIICTRKGCDLSDTVTIRDVRFNERNYNFKLIKDERATCADEGCRGYSFGIDYAYETDKGTVKETLNCYVEIVIDKLDHKFVMTPALDEDGNPVLDYNGKQIMVDKIFSIEVVEDGMTYSVSYKICAECGKTIMVSKDLKAGE